MSDTRRTEYAEGAVRGLGRSHDHIRQHNLSVLLRQSHHDGSISRAELTRITGLNRSTIGALVAELVELGLVVESEPDAVRHSGRPSSLVKPDSRTVALAINPEVDAVTVGVVDLASTVVRTVRRETTGIPSVADAVAMSATIIADLRAELDVDHRIVGIGVAVPGLVRSADGMVSFAPHLGWKDAPLGDLIASATGLPVTVGNDASLGAIAESQFGAGRHVGNMIYLNGGASGIGSGIIAAGSLLLGAEGYSGELGHTFVGGRGTRCRCGAIGCLETEVSRAALLSNLGMLTADGESLTAALRASRSPLVRETVAAQLTYLAIALRNATNMFNPETIVLGGFLGSIYEAQPELLLDLLSKQSPQLSVSGFTVALAELGSDVLMIGAAELAFERLFADPAGYVALLAESGTAAVALV